MTRLLIYNREGLFQIFTRVGQGLEGASMPPSFQTARGEIAAYLMQDETTVPISRVVQTVVADTTASTIAEVLRNILTAIMKDPVQFTAACAQGACLE